MRSIAPKTKSYIAKWRESERKLAVRGFFPSQPTRMKPITLPAIGKGSVSTPLAGDSEDSPPA